MNRPWSPAGTSLGQVFPLDQLITKAADTIRCTGKLWETLFKMLIAWFREKPSLEKLKHVNAQCIVKES